MNTHATDQIGIIIQESRLYVPGIYGLAALWHVTDDARPGRDHFVKKLCEKRNQIQFSWGYIAAMTLGLGNRDFRVRTLYIEYENVNDPGTVITAPVPFGRDEGISYYRDLTYSSDRDYLRVPLIQEPMISVEPGYEAYFPEEGTGNRLTFFAMSQGTQGVHGRQFSDLVNSKIFGAALVATPNFGDPSQDVLLARTYFEEADQTVKAASSQVGITWDVVFK